ncbi:hypothetical protein BJ978_000282 [Agromyces terreus]|uniref:DUF4179 domain-containing protein n=1 Tax=Agromyces terreus TaxID=424795 RepID=A0A9X2GY62_9MICO|nr:hypothetical protein [Agromyces terreus]MCP2369606.1 hypothetical protein [Agromyces terreus]
MDDDLDRLLLRSKPDVAERSTGLTEALDRLLDEAHPPRRQRWRPVLAGSFIVFALAGGASVAAAAPGVLAWFGWTDNTTSYSHGDERCDEGFRVVPASESSDGDSPSLQAAREYLASLDIDAIDLSAQLAEDAQDGSRSRNPESVARSTLIYDMTITHVAALGLPTSDISIESGGVCEGRR